MKRKLLQSALAAIATMFSLNVSGQLDTFINYGWTIKTDATIAAFDPALASVSHPNSPSKLYMLGGVDGVNLLDDVQKFDPATNLWSSVSSMLTANYTSSATAINDKIYVIGGYSPPFYGIDNNQIYDVATDSWSSGTPMPTLVGDYAIGVYHDSLIYYFGGYDATAGTDYNLVQIYDPLSDTWTSGTHIPASGYGWQSGIAGNKIVLSGGANITLGLISATYVGTIDQTDPSDITWVQVDDYPLGAVFRAGSGTSIDPSSGLVVFTGGDPDGYGTTTVAATYAYDVNSNEWKIGPDKPTSANNLRNLACVVYADSIFLAAVGGYDGSNVLAANEWLNLGPAPFGTDITEDHLMSFDLSSYPNPFSKFTSISFSLDHSSTVRISIVDVMGKEVQVLCDKVLPAGPQQIVWNAFGYDAGVYFCKMNVNGNVVTQKLVKLH